MVKKNRHMEMRVLVCQLSEDEVDAKSRELARATMDMRDQEEARTAYVENTRHERKRLDEAVKDRRAAVIDLATAVSTRTVERDVPCDWRFDLESGKAILVRRDTDVAVEKRDMTDEERQLKIGETLEAANADQVSLWKRHLLEAEARRAKGEPEPPPPGEPGSETKRGRKKDPKP